MLVSPCRYMNAIEPASPMKPLIESTLLFIMRPVIAVPQPIVKHTMKRIGTNTDLPAKKCEVPDGARLSERTMILTSNGQNVYPEEIEDKMNNQPYVVESVVLERDKQIVALVFPDQDRISQEQLDSNGVAEIMSQRNPSTPFSAQNRSMSFIFFQVSRLP